jgi:hypothetical protein
MYRYWLTLRPAMPGAIPTKGLERVVNYATRTYEGCIGRNVWGYVEYSRQLSDADVDDYDLIEDRA